MVVARGAEEFRPMYAIFEDGSHQFRASEGDFITVDRRDGEAGTEITFDKILLLAGTGGEPTIGAPLVEGAKVVAKITRQFRDKNHHPEVPPPQEHASSPRPPPAVHDCTGHQRRRGLRSPLPLLRLAASIAPAVNLLLGRFH